MYRIFFLIILSSLMATEIKIGSQVLSVEVVETPEERAFGLMGRKTLPEGTGMLFIYPYPQPLNFWMKNTLIPLSVAFFDREKKLLNMADMNPPQEGHPLKITSSQGLAVYALEVPQGWFVKHNIGPGVKFSFLDQ